jgi:hypothetical protein
LVLSLFTDDPFAPYHAEFMGHRLSADMFWVYPRWLFLRDHLGDFVYSWYPHLLVFFVLSSRWLAIRTSPEIFWWFACVFVALNFNVKRADGAWFTAFRNVRHGHVLVYPLILLLTGLSARSSPHCGSAPPRTACRRRPSPGPRSWRPSPPSADPVRCPVLLGGSFDEL